MAIAIEQRRRQQIQQAAVRSSPCSIAHASPAGTLAVELAIQRSGARRTTAKRGGCAWARQRRGQGDETTARYHAGVHTRAQRPLALPRVGPGGFSVVRTAVH
eukprot:COSAG06_NODE_400_length_16205_cov_13.911275_5_plen_103_part_00